MLIFDKLLTNKLRFSFQCVSSGGDSGLPPSHYCFMGVTPFLAGLALPASVLTALLIGLALSAWCVAGSSSSSAAAAATEVREEF